ncbi:hypothetical protein BGX30_012873 [Mortierella sp. GBA39]|nr:hypothetical protein BGX30_012873 [Mortierella sp. GBA39]
MSLFYLLCALTTIPFGTFAFNVGLAIQQATKGNNPLEFWNWVNSYHWVPLSLRRWFYVLLLSFNSPFLSAIDYRVTELSKGKAVLTMKTVRKNSNLYGTVHAGAMVTFAETTGAIALFSTFKPKDRALATNINVQYFKKASGMLTATSVIPEIKDYTIKDLNTEVLVTNEQMETVVKMTITFRVDYRSAKAE